MSQENVEELIEGYPLYIYYMSMSFQFCVLPLLCVFYNKPIYKSAFIGLMAKDFLVTTTNTMMNAHHGLCILYTMIYCHTQNVAMIVTAGEIGSGVFNVYTIAKHYDHDTLDEIFWVYAVIMTFSNIYCFISLYNLKEPIYMKIPLYGLFLMRQYFVCK